MVLLVQDIPPQVALMLAPVVVLEVIQGHNKDLTIKVAEALADTLVTVVHPPQMQQLVAVVAVAVLMEALVERVVAVV